MKRIIMLLIFAFSLAGCAGTPFNWSAARKIDAGMSVAEVQGLIGYPYGIHKRDDGTFIYVWSYAGLLETQVLSIHFRDGKVVESPPIPDNL